MSFPEQPFGFVAGRWVLSIGDTPDDPDRAPDYVPVRDGAVVFTPQVTHRVAADGPGWAGIIKDRVLGGVGERGQLIDAEGHDHLALAVGIYSVSYDFGPGMSWPSHYIEVKPEHTADAPLWLPPIAPPPEGPRIENRVITIPADGEDGQVLVWDGAGFSWDYNPGGKPGPVGPQGPAIDIDTGLPISVDTTVGTRVFIGGHMVHGDTGWRNIEHLLSTDWHQPTGADHFHIRREGTRIHLRLRIKRKTPGTRGNFTPILNTLNGFSPPTYATFGPANVATDIGVIANPTNITTIGVAYIPGTWVDGDTLTASATWDTVQPWPATLPGLPA